MRRLTRLVSPLITLIVVQLVWILLVILWITWLVGRHKELRRLAEHYRPEMVPPGFNWPVLVEGLALMLLILAGFYVIFLYWRRQSRLYQEQKDFFSQITHEFKSPLASIQLHLETIRLRKLQPEKMERFLDTMLDDTERLNNLINNLLMAARLEQRRRDIQYPVIDFSAFVAHSLEQKRKQLPEGGNLALELEPGIKVALDVEGMETALRNLFENAVLYSPVSPEIRVRLERDGKECRLIFGDNGKGINPAEFKKIFKMFYRVRQAGETIRGSGLGLHIVKSVVSEHRGKITVASEGNGRGSTFTITLPLAQEGR